METQVHPHLERLADAIRSEDDWKRRELSRLLSLSFEDQLCLGVSWPVCRVEDEEPAGREYAVWLLRAPKGAVLHEGIDVGETVTVRALGSGDCWDGRVVGLDHRTATVRVRTDVDAPAEVQVSKRHDASQGRLQRAVLAEVPEEVSGVAAVLLGRAPSVRETPTPTVAGITLDASQQAAVEHVLAAADVALVHGPPGTGKTRTLTALLQSLVASGDRPWALADSNAAADLLALRASAAGLRVVRVGHAARMGSEAAELSLDACVRRHGLWPAIVRIDKQISRLRSFRSPGGHREIRELYRERRTLLDQARDAVIEDAQVLAITLGTLLRRAASLPAPETAVVDEATQAIEPAVWAVVPWVERLVLVGDPHQLGPVVMEPGNPLQVGLLQRLLDRGLPAPMLQTQYRMHENVAAMVSDVYGPQYRPHPSVAEHRLCDLEGVTTETWTERPLWFVDTAGAGLDEELDARSGSRFNRGEVQVIAAVVSAWREAGVRPEDIGVIAPYRAQVRRLRDHPALAGVEVDTVNSFQGREKEAVAVSFVRSNDDGEVGFVADQRRLTVALTRGRRAWFGVGDSATLALVDGVQDMLAIADAVGGLDSVWSWEVDGL